MMLAMDHVKKTYRQFSLDCSLNVEEGQVTGLIGENGAGKSTTFKAALGLIFPDGGQIRILGKPLEKLTAKDREEIGAVLGDSGFNENLNVRQIASIMNTMYRQFDREKFLDRCRKFQLGETVKLKEYSTGMLAKLKVLTAVSHQARFLILDEPTAGLDVVARDAVLDLLREYIAEDESRSILISSHISGDLEGICDDLYMIHQGKIVFHEDTDVLLGSYGLIKADEGQFSRLDKEHLLRVKRTDYGYQCLTAHRDFYLENYPGLVVEKGSVDSVITMMIGGKKA